MGRVPCREWLRFHAVANHRGLSHHSRINVTSNVTRYSVILPSSTLPFSEITSNPVTPRKVFVARLKPSSAACWNPSDDDAVTLVTLATAMIASPLLVIQSSYHLSRDYALR